MRTNKINFVARISNVSRLQASLPVLSRVETDQDCKIGFDTWADTSCAGKHAHVLEWIEGHTSVR